MEEGVSERKYGKNEKLMIEKRQDTSPIEDGKVVNDRKDGKKKNDEEKETKCPNDTPPVDMEKGVSERKNDKNEKLMSEKRQNAQMALLLMVWRKV